MNHEILVTSFRNPCNSFISIQLGKMSSSTNNLNNQLKTLFRHLLVSKMGLKHMLKLRLLLASFRVKNVPESVSCRIQSKKLNRSSKLTTKPIHVG